MGNLDSRLVHIDGIVHLSLQGDIDIDSVPELTAALREAISVAGEVVQVDISAVGFMSAAGVSALVSAEREARGHSIDLRMTGAGAEARGLLDGSDRAADMPRSGPAAPGGWDRVNELLRYSVEHADGERRVRFAGEVDLSCTAGALEVVNRVSAPGTRLVMDMSRVTFADASAITLMIEAQRVAGSASGRLVVRRPSRAVRRLLELSQLEPLFDVDQPEGAAPLSHRHQVEKAKDALCAAVKLAGADMGTVQLHHPSEEALVLAGHLGVGARFADFFEVVDQPDCACGSALTSGHPVWVADVHRSVVFAGSPALEVVAESGVGSVASLPLRGRRGDMVGMLSVHRRRATEWTTNEQSLLLAFADGAGQALSA